MDSNSKYIYGETHPNDYGISIWTENPSNYKMQKEAKRFYITKKCVLTEFGQSSTEWHHLDLNRNNNAIGNVVPINGSHHNNISLNKVDDILNSIKSKSLEHWREGKFQMAYGTNRLGCFLYAGKLPYQCNDSIMHSIEALHCLRPIWELAYAYDTIKRSIIDVLYNDENIKYTNNDTFAFLCKEIAAWYLLCYDFIGFGHWNSLGCDFNKLYKTSLSLQFNLNEAKLLQHEGFFQFIKKDFTSAKKTIIKSDNHFIELQNKYGHANNQQYLISMALQDNYNKQKKEAKTIYKQNELLLNKIDLTDIRNWDYKKSEIDLWLYTAFLYHKAEILRMMGETEKSKDYLKCLNVYLQTTKIKTLLNYGEYGVREYFYKFDDYKSTFAPLISKNKMHPDFNTVLMKLFISLKDIYTKRRDL